MVMTIREWCDLNEMSFNEFSKLVPCTQPYVGMMDSGKATPSWKMAGRVEEITGGLVPRTRWYPERSEPIGQGSPGEVGYDVLEELNDE